MKLAESNLARTAVATSWNYSGRLVGLGWTALLISKMGIGEYGQYAIGIAAAALINAAVDNAFYVRSLRIDDSRFEGERCSRVLVGLVLAVLGVATFPANFVAGFAIIIAAGELFFNTFKSQYMRVGRPDVALRFDAFRQFVSIGLAAAYLMLAVEPELSVAVALYVLPYSAVMICCLRYVPGRKPLQPGDLRQIALLSTEALAAAIYAQGDLLVVGLVAGDEVTGYYSVALVTALAVSTIGQHYATTFVERLRDSGGALNCAPGPANVLRVALTTGCSILAVGVGILLWGRADQLAHVMIIMSVWVAARTIQHTYIVVLFAQHRDALRVRATATAAVSKLVLLFPAVHFFGAYGAATTAVVCEITMVLVYHHMIYGHRGARFDTSEIG